MFVVFAANTTHFQIFIGNFYPLPDVNQLQLESNHFVEG